MTSEKEVEQLIIRLYVVDNVIRHIDYSVKAAVEHISVYCKALLYRFL